LAFVFSGTQTHIHNLSLSAFWTYGHYTTLSYLQLNFQIILQAFSASFLGFPTRKVTPRA
jgi:hypothetical protein